MRSPVVMRKKHGSPAKNRGWQRHSLEVTTPARYLKETSFEPLKPLDSASPLCISTSDAQFFNDENNPSEGTGVTTLGTKPPGSNPETKQQTLPFAITALEQVWQHVKSNCAEIVFSEGISPGGAPSEIKGPSAKWPKDGFSLIRQKPKLKKISHPRQASTFYWVSFHLVTFTNFHPLKMRNSN
jgi:hypothetical protein